MPAPEGTPRRALGGPELDALRDLAEFLSRRRDLDEILTACVTRAAALLGCPRASIRVLDQARSQLIARCRAGEPIHTEATPFALGEGLVGWVALHVRPIRTSRAESDPRFAARESRTISLGSYLGVPLVAAGECLGVLSFAHGDDDAFDESHEALAVVIAALVAPHVELARVAHLTRLDPLTGLLNRRGLAALEQTGGAEGVQGSVICVDLDRFKSVNDRYGHAIGDRVLVMVADTLARAVRRGDSVARTGGEEFLVVLPGAPLGAAVRIAESARKAIAASAIESAEGAFHVTSSFGVAERRDGETHEACVARADAALYEAKRAGRDRVVTG